MTYICQDKSLLLVIFIYKKKAAQSQYDKVDLIS